MQTKDMELIDQGQSSLRVLGARSCKYLVGYFVLKVEQFKSELGSLKKTSYLIGLVSPDLERLFKLRSNKSMISVVEKGV